MTVVRVYFEPDTRRVTLVHVGEDIHLRAPMTHWDIDSNEIDMDVITLEMDGEYQRARNIRENIEIDTDKNFKWKDDCPASVKRSHREVGSRIQRRRV